MKNLLKSILGSFLILAFAEASAHYLWIQTSEAGKLDQAHHVKVFYGEYTYGVIEDPNGDNFSSVKNFKLWVITPSGKKAEIETTTGDDAFYGEFVPTEKGTYTVVMNNDEIDVVDYTRYDFGIFKTHYHSTAKVVVGGVVSDMQPTNTSGLSILNTSANKLAVGEEVKLKVMYKGNPVAEGHEVVVYVADLWSKKLQADANGEVSFKLPWETTYTVETTTKEDLPGTYKGEDYEFVWHCATYAMAL